MKLDHLSVSQISMFARCEYQYYQRYVKGKKIPPSGTIILGRSVDDAVNVDMLQKIETGRNLNPGKIQELFASSFEKKILQAELRKNENPAELKDSGVKGVVMLQQEVYKKVQPVTVQNKIITYFEDTNVKFVSIADLEDDSGMIHDTKTAGKKWARGKELQELQPVAYCMANPKYSRFQYNIVTGTKTPMVQVINREVANDEVQGFLKMLYVYIRQIQKKIKTGLFLPRRDHFLCSKTWCGYWRECEREWGLKIKD